MREDMFKVIVERPRTGWRSMPRCRGRLAGEDDLPTKIGMKRHVTITRIRSRWLNENLNPLKRYLGRQVGRRWDDVYSEICATLDTGHTVKQHVRQHIDDFVVRKVVSDRDGEWMNGRAHPFGRHARVWHQPYYVDPEDGVLKDSMTLWAARGIVPRSWKHPKPQPDPNVRVLDEMRELRCIDGNWYEIGFHVEPDALAWTFDLVERQLVPAAKRYAVSKRQLSRSELKAFGISNKQPN